MANIYFTNTLVSGDGSFWQAILDARDGDSVLPSPNVAWDRDIIIDFTGSGSLQRDFPANSTIVVGDNEHVITLKNATGTAMTFFRQTKSANITFNNIICRDSAVNASYGVFFCVNSSTDVITLTFNNCQFIGLGLKGVTSRNGTILSVQAGNSSNVYTFNNCIAANNVAATGDNFRVPSGSGTVVLNNFTQLNGSTSPANLSTFTRNNSLITQESLVHADVLRDAGYVCCDETSSSRLDLHLLDEGASADLTNTTNLILRIRAHKLDGTYTDYGSSTGNSADTEAPSNVSYTVVDNENIDLSWTANLDETECNYLEVEYSKDGGSLWRLKAVLEQRDSRSSITLCLNPATARTAGTSTTVSKDLDGYDRPNTGFSAGAYQDLGTGWFIRSGNVLSSRFLFTTATSEALDSEYSSDLYVLENEIINATKLTGSEDITLNLFDNTELNIIGNSKFSGIDAGDNCSIKLSAASNSTEVFASFTTLDNTFGENFEFKKNENERCYLTFQQGYELPEDIDVSEFIVGQYGAKVRSFSLTKFDNTHAIPNITIMGNGYVILEKKNALGNFEVLSDRFAYNTPSVAIEEGTNTFRIFDGDGFFTASVMVAPSSAGLYYVYRLSNYCFSNVISPFRYEPIVFMAQIKDESTDAFLTRNETQGIKLTLKKASNPNMIPITWTEVPKWTNVTIPNECVIEPKNYDIWDLDPKEGDDNYDEDATYGANFIYMPIQTVDSSNNVMNFVEDSGSYRAIFTITRSNGQDIVFQSDFEVL